MKHLVPSSVLLLRNGKIGVPHVDSKVEVERYARDKKVPMTIVRPASFMDNIGSRFFPVGSGRARGFVAPDAEVSYICMR
jgi:uncharacterized protein YbjT (DUF2867 family)